MRPTERSGDDAMRFCAQSSQGGWLRRTAIGMLEGLLDRLNPTPPTDSAAILIETMPFGVACWGADARLVASNSRFAERLRSGQLAAGAAYHDVVRGLAQGGYMQS